MHRIAKEAGGGEEKADTGAPLEGEGEAFEEADGEETPADAGEAAEDGAAFWGEGGGGSGGGCRHGEFLGSGRYNIIYDAVGGGVVQQCGRFIFGGRVEVEPK